MFRNQFQSRDGGSSQPLVVVVRVTTACSLGCQFCGFSRELQRPPRTIDSSLLLDLGARLQKLQKDDGRKFLVTWLGGEPFQWPDWLAISREYVERFDLNLGITTNGLALCSATVRQHAVRLFRQITVSLDGLAEHHDHLRQSPGLFQRLQGAVKGLNGIRDRGQTLLRVNTVLTAHNIGSFPEFCREMADWGFDELTFNQLGGNDRPEFYPENRLRPGQVFRFRELLEEIRSIASQRGLQVRGSPAYLDRIVATANDRRLAVAECDPGERFLFVDENGLCSPCSFTGAELGSPIADLLDRGQAGLVAWFRANRLRCRPAVCEDCHATHVFEKFL